MESNNIKNIQEKDSARGKCNKKKSGTGKGSRTTYSFLLKPLSFFILLSLPGFAFSAETFNPEMLKAIGDGGDMDGVNLDYFAEKGGQMPNAGHLR